VALNAGACIYVVGRAASIEEGVRAARHAMASGAARAKLEQLIAFGHAAG
jgi:anthranilate phosphoribosyltransferase